jgi:hypothetical protein
MQQAGTAVYRVEDMEFGRRLAMERELELPGPDGRIPGRWSNVIWDESGAFILYPSLLGIKGEAIQFELKIHALISAVSCQYRHKSCCSTFGEGRGCALVESQSIPRCPG